MIAVKRRLQPSGVSSGKSPVDKNALSASEPLPKFYWTRDTEMQCFRDAIGQALDYGYAHHIQRMQNYCGNCRYDPAESAAENARPFTALYWDFLMRTDQKLTNVGRMDMQLRNLVRIEAVKKAAITKQANELKESYR